MLGGLLSLAACAGQETPPPAPAQVARTPRVGVLLPLSGANARLGAEMLNGARLATRAAGSPELDVRDTAAAGGATQAAQAAVANGDGILLGPLTGGWTADVAPIATAANVPVLAFTSDTTQARPGVWALGISPEAQVDRLVDAAASEGRQHFAAFLPDNAFGRALAAALRSACTRHGLSDPAIVFHLSDPQDIAARLAGLTDFDARLSRAQAAQAPAAAPSAVDPTGAAPTAPSPATPPTTAPSAPTLDAPPFDALLLGDTGLDLARTIDLLHTQQVSASHVRLLGPGLWSAFASKLGRIGGAWYAAPDPRARQTFVQQFLAAYHHMPTPLADLSYDSAALARALNDGSGVYRVDALTKSNGFAGVDGLFTLMPDGHVRRRLAVFEIQPTGGAHMVTPGAHNGT
ncbi:penicillin-binding protein activator [Ameyamaea chiangmaiensis]|nr:penicillin-binding protein activator [Ameyamaea chiangmaiensis]